MILIIKIVHESENNRAAAYDDNKNIGESTYVKDDGVWVINHTFVESNYGGRGIASKLVAKIVEEVRNNNIKIIPVCPFAKKEFERKEEYSDVLSNRR